MQKREGVSSGPLRPVDQSTGAVHCSDATAIAGGLDVLGGGLSVVPCLVPKNFGNGHCRIFICI